MPTNCKAAVAVRRKLPPRTVCVIIDSLLVPSQHHLGIVYLPKYRTILKQTAARFILSPRQSKARGEETECSARLDWKIGHAIHVKCNYVRTPQED